MGLRLRSVAERRRHAMSLRQVGRDRLGDPPARPAFERDGRPKLERLSQRAAIPALLAESEMRHCPSTAFAR